MSKMAGKKAEKKSQYFYSCAIIIVVSTVCFGLSEFMGYRVTALILLVTVSILAVLFDILPVLISSTLSAFIWGFFFIPPRYTIHISNSEDSILLFMYFVIAMINGALTYKIRQVEKTLRLKEERANSVKLYNTILNSLSHELRTPIAAIIGATDNLQFNKNLTLENRQQLIAEISKASLRLNQQVDNLLNISRLESGHIQPKYDWCDVIELIYMVVTRVEENSGHKKINININPNMPICKLDKGMLDQILYNLVKNAVIHTDLQSTIYISASCYANLLEVIIEDNGPGFKEIKLNEVFDKFSRGGSLKTHGSGLGLSIVKGFTEALKGNVTLQKGTFGGARFTITIPVKTNQNIEINE